MTAPIEPRRSGVPSNAWLVALCGPMVGMRVPGGCGLCECHTEVISSEFPSADDEFRVLALHEQRCPFAHEEPDTDWDSVAATLADHIRRYQEEGANST